MGHISTGTLPKEAEIRTLVQHAYDLFRENADGQNSTVYPALAVAPSARFGISLVATDGRAFQMGDAECEFTIMSVSKPFAFALVCDRLGPEVLRDRIGVDATGLPFDSIAAVEKGAGPTNPMVNPGAIAVSSLCPGDSLEARWNFLHEGLCRFAGRSLSVNQEIYRSACESNHRNRSASRLLQAYGRIYSDPDEALELYTRQCSLNVTAEVLATMGATLAAGGIQPNTRERVVEPMVCHYTLAIMVTAGLYERSGSWLYDIGLPGKSGIGGGMITVSPGKGALATYAPRLDAYGNSIKGQLTAKYLSQELGLDLFLSSADSSPFAPLPHSHVER